MITLPNVHLGRTSYLCLPGYENTTENMLLKDVLV